MAFNHSSGIEYEDVIEYETFIKKCTAKPYCFLMIDTTLASDNSYVTEIIF